MASRGGHVSGRKPSFRGYMERLEGCLCPTLSCSLCALSPWRPTQGLRMCSRATPFGHDEVCLVFASEIGCLICDRLNFRQRSAHIFACVKRSLARDHELLQRDIYYCYGRFDWTFGDDCKEHCEAHISELVQSRRCGTLTYASTFIRPAHCPFHLDYEEVDAADQVL
jgi:hypothetical protein